MASKAEIGWKSRNEEGEKRDVYAQHFGGKWIIFDRAARFDQWTKLENPPLVYWLELLDAVRRRIPRRLIRPEEEELIITEIRERFPEAEI